MPFNATAGAGGFPNKKTLPRPPSDGTHLGVRRSQEVDDHIELILGATPERRPAGGRCVRVRPAACAAMAAETVAWWC